MLILDQVQKDDSRLRTIAVVILAGMLFLAGGLWRLQILAAQRYSKSERAQSVRLVRVPAVRGKILDRNGIPLAENRPGYDVNLYLEELRTSFRFEYTNHVLPTFRAEHPGLRRPTGTASLELQELARLNVYSNTVMAVASALRSNLPVSAEGFQKHYRQALALPLPVAENLSPVQMARFFERGLGVPGVDLEVQAVRTYPYGTLAAHILGHLRRSDEAENDPEPLVFRYRLPDYEGAAGIEAKLDEALRGRAGVKWLRVNSQGYRHEETVYEPTEPGNNVRLTIDASVQQVAERALASTEGGATRGAVVVMDVRDGDILAMVSLPQFDPNLFVEGISTEEYARLNDEKMAPQMNRAVSGKYAPGSIFKIVTGLAALDGGVLDPLATNYYLGYWAWPNGARSIDDLAPAGFYDFKKAFKRSSNAYFIDYGLKAGRARIVAMAKRFGLGDTTDFLLGPESRGDVPDADYVRRTEKQGDPWTDGDTAQLSIGQGALTVTPLQMAVMTAAVANGGRILKPRLVQRIETTDGTTVTEFPPAPVRNAGISAQNLSLVREAMLADVQESGGTGKAAAIQGWRVSGKTGTAEVKHGRAVVDKITWFVSFAPFESPRYAVVVVVESGRSGGGTSAPVARQVFQALHEWEATPQPIAPPGRLRITEAASGESIRRDLRADARAGWASRGGVPAIPGEGN